MSKHGLGSRAQRKADKEYNAKQKAKAKANRLRKQAR